MCCEEIPSFIKCTFGKRSPTENFLINFREGRCRWSSLHKQLWYFWNVKTADCWRWSLSLYHNCFLGQAEVEDSGFRLAETPVLVLKDSEGHGLLSLERAWECSHSYMELIFPRVKICGRKRQCPDIKHLGNSFPSPTTPTARKYFLMFSLSPSCFSVSSFPLTLSKTEIGNSCSPSIGSCSWGPLLHPFPKSSLLQNK